MFNVCPSCGEYRPGREVRAEEGVAVCECGHVQAFRPGPLFLVGGASGTGKSTVLDELAGPDLPVIALDGDILWREEFRSDVLDWATVWLRLAKNLGLAGKPAMIFGAGLVVPENVEPSVERRYFSVVHRLALTCEEAVLRARLQARPAWRRSSGSELENQLGFNGWIQANADEQGIDLVDTTHLTVAETRNRILEWLRSRI